MGKDGKESGMIDISLKPCPFCGSDTVYFDASGKGRFAWVECGDCRARSSSCEISLEHSACQEAADEWNRRVEMTNEEV